MLGWRDVWISVSIKICRENGVQGAVTLDVSSSRCSELLDLGMELGERQCDADNGFGEFSFGLGQFEKGRGNCVWKSGTVGRWQSSR